MWDAIVFGLVFLKTFSNANSTRFGSKQKDIFSLMLRDGTESDVAGEYKNTAVNNGMLSQPQLELKGSLSGIAS
ncbi:hypothetical protein EIP86_008872, partial [Pleurotus ostreatoroseus]